jgi:excinuclease UvrABC ATPase subunit
MHKPDVDSIEGLSLAISIEHKKVSRKGKSEAGLGRSGCIFSIAFPGAIMIR